MKKRTRRKKERKKWKKGFSRKRVFEREREMTEQGRANGSGGDRPRANYASASALVLAEANLWKTRASTAVVISRRSHSTRAPCRVIVSRCQGRMPRREIASVERVASTSAYLHPFFLPSFLSFFPSLLSLSSFEFVIAKRLNGTSVAIASFSGRSGSSCRGFLLFTEFEFGS